MFKPSRSPSIIGRIHGEYSRTSNTAAGWGGFDSYVVVLHEEEGPHLISTSLSHIEESPGCFRRFFFGAAASAQKSLFFAQRRMARIRPMVSRALVRHSVVHDSLEWDVPVEKWQRSLRKSHRPGFRFRRAFAFLETGGDSNERPIRAIHYDSIGN